MLHRNGYAYLSHWRGFELLQTSYPSGWQRRDNSSNRLQLVAVEYIIPYTLRSRSATPPVLFGQQFKQNDAFQLWGLHAWVWRSNPSGLFADWNPSVNCNAAMR